MQFLQAILIIQAGIFGLLIGSFLNVCIYRMPKKMTLMGRSYCPTCQNLIPWYRNIPIFAYTLQRGMSHCCKEKISIQYPLIEGLTAILSVATIKYIATLPSDFPLALYFIWFLFFVSPLIVLSIIDFQIQELPDVITLPGILVGILVRQATVYPNFVSGFVDSLLGILLGGGILLFLGVVISKLKNQEAMGGGDIKLMAMLGAFLGYKSLIFIFFASSILALVYIVLLTLLKKFKKDQTIPFGPFISMAGLIYFLYGKIITDWYFSIYGIQGNWFFES